MCPLLTFSLSSYSSFTDSGKFILISCHSDGRQWTFWMNVLGGWGAGCQKWGALPSTCFNCNGLGEDCYGRCIYSHISMCTERNLHTKPWKKKKMDFSVGNSFFLILAPGLYCAVKQAITWQQLGGLEPNTWSSPILALQWQLTVQSHSQVALLQWH